MRILRRQRGLLLLAVVLAAGNGRSLADSAEHMPVATSALALALRLPAALRQTFARFDRDGDGRLSRREWQPLVRDPEDAPVDLDGDGFISLQEFARAFVLVNSRRAPNEGLLAKRYTSEAQRLVAAGDLEQAERQLLNATREYPGWAGTWTTLGDVRCLRKRPAEAREAYLRSIALAPGGQVAWMHLVPIEYALGHATRCNEALAKGMQLLALRLSIYGRGTRRENELGHAEGEVLRAVQYFTQEAALPEKSLVILEQARAFLGLRSKLEAARIWALAQLGRGHLLEELERLTKQFGPSLTLLATRARLLRLESRPDDAVESFREALKLTGSTQERRLTMLDLCSSLESAGRTSEASRTLATLETLCRSPAELGDLVRLQLRGGQRARALALLHRMKTRFGNRDGLDAFEHDLLAGDVEKVRTAFARERLPSPERCLWMLDLLSEKGTPPKEIVQVLDEALQLLPGSLPLAFEKVRRLEGAGLDAEALAAAEAALSVHPSAAELYLDTGRLLSRTSRHEEALASLRRARELSSDPTRVGSLEVCVYLDLGRRDEALAMLGKLREAKLGPDATQVLAHALMARREWRAGLDWLEATLRTGRDTAHNRLLLAQAQFNAGDTAGAKGTLRSLKPEGLAGDASDQFLLAELLMQLGSRAEAVTYQRRGVELKPHDVQARRVLAVLLTDLGQPAEAGRTIAEALARPELNSGQRLELEELRAQLAGGPGERATRPSSAGEDVIPQPPGYK